MRLYLVHRFPFLFVIHNPVAPEHAASLMAHDFHCHLLRHSGLGEISRSAASQIVGDTANIFLFFGPGVYLVVANQEYKGHIISVSVIYDTYSRYQFTPVIDIRLAESSQVLNTILTRQAFNTIENANEFGFALVREWVDEETPSSED